VRLLELPHRPPARAGPILLHWLPDSASELRKESARSLRLDLHSPDAQTILDRSVATRVLPSAIFTADTFAKIPILQKPIGHVWLSLLVISNIEAPLQNFGLFTHRPSDDAYGWPP
jgi:hypothetical protein